MKLSSRATLGILKGYLAILKSNIDKGDKCNISHAQIVIKESLDLCWDLESSFVEDLTDRENEIKNLVVKGHSNQEIADQLMITDKTVKFHLGFIFRKIGVTNRAALIVEHYKNALIIAEQDKRLLQEKVDRMSAGDDRGRPELSIAPVPGDVK